MAKVCLLRKSCVILVVWTAMTVIAPAQSYTILYTFGTPGDGFRPYAGLIQGTDGNFYGTTLAGGNYICSNACGTVFELTPAGGFTNLHTFDSTDGAYPYAGLIQATDGNFYGTTEAGGSNNCEYGCGTVFRIIPGGTLTTLYSFCLQSGCSDGSEPYAGLIQAADGNFYGATNAGGANGYGTIFKITPDGTLTTLHSFCRQTGCSDGASPKAAPIQAADGNFYGTTEYGGANGNGTVFKITPAGILTTLYSFCGLANCSDGKFPYAGLIQGTDGNFFGTTLQGGDYYMQCGQGCGTVFKITRDGALTTLHSFNGYDGEQPYDGLIQATDGNFYGTVSHGENFAQCTSGCGAVFEITATGTLSTLHRFESYQNPPDGAYPYAGLIQATDGNLYGTTSTGGTGGGTVFRFSATPAVTLSPISPVNFGKQALDQTSVAKTVSLKNSGAALLLMSGVAIDGGGFAISANTCRTALDIGKRCNVSVTFTPTVLGKFTGTLTFTNNASNSPQTEPLSGTGTQPATLTPASATYASQTVRTTSTPKTFILTNNQSVVLTGVAITTTGDFAISATTCSSSLNSKASCTISVTFTPTATGTRTGIVSVSDSSSNSPQTSNLKGTGK